MSKVRGGHKLMAIFVPEPYYYVVSKNVAWGVSKLL